MKEDYERINNQTLVNDNLHHALVAFEDDNLSFVRIAVECHQILLRSMVESLKGTANLAITGRSKDKTRTTLYKLGDGGWKKIQKTKINGCKRAWRFSEPIDILEEELHDFEKRSQKVDNFLHGFYDLLAMIQSEYFMKRYVMSKTISINDEDMKTLEWLHEKVRNEVEHFIPKIYLVDSHDLLEASMLCLEISHFLLFESGNVTIKNLLDSGKWDSLKIKIEENIHRYSGS
ncbi:MAG: hypothetical protein AB1656_21260 [Candidatus Omnitrophota bacterium]